MEREVRQEIQGLRTEQATFKPWAREEFWKVVKNQQRYGATLPSAFQRQDPVRQAFIRNENAASARQGAQQRHQQQQQQQQEQQRRPPALVTPTAVRV